jgi:ribosomal protein S18 acetylase RimI-like enzyme
MTESLTCAVDYTQVEIQTFWSEEVERVMANKDSIIIKATATSSPSSTEIVGCADGIRERLQLACGCAVFEKVSLEELQERQELVDLKLDPIEFALLQMRKEFWAMYSGRYLSSGPVYRMTYLAVAKEHERQGIAGQLVDVGVDIIKRSFNTQSNSDSDSDRCSSKSKVVVYTEASSIGTVRICEKRKWACWRKFKLGDLSSGYYKLLESINARSNHCDDGDGDGDVSVSFKEFCPIDREEEVHLQVLEDLCDV